MAKQLQKPFYLITDGWKLRKEGKLLGLLCELVEQCSDVLGYLQVREQVVDNNPARDEEVGGLLKELQPLCKEKEVKLIVNANAAIFSAFDLDGLHVGRRSIVDLSKNSKKIFGYSAHSVEEGVSAFHSGFDYVFLSPIFSSQSKKQADPLGLQPLQELCFQTDKAVFALGGIGVEEVALCKRTGASGVACLSSILYAHNPVETLQAMAREWV